MPFYQIGETFEQSITELQPDEQVIYTSETVVFYTEKADAVAGTFTLTSFRVIWKHPKGKKLNVSIGLLSVYPDKFKFTHDLAEIRA